MSIDRLRAHWGLSRTPFTKELATSMLFASAAHQEAVARVSWIVAERSLGVVCGEVGAGKTVAARAATASLDSSRYSIIYLPNPAVGARGIYTQIVTALGATPRFYRATLIPQATDLLAAESAERGKTVVLILDEAHLLCAEQLEELRMLTNSEMDSRATFACLLLGQPTLRRKLRQGTFAALDQRIALRCTIDGMDRKETGEYIAHHVKLAGRTDTIFSDDAVTLIHDASRGLPRAVNNLATQTLIAAYASQQVDLRRELRPRRARRDHRRMTSQVISLFDQPTAGRPAAGAPTAAATGRLARATGPDRLSRTTRPDRSEDRAAHGGRPGRDPDPAAGLLRRADRTRRVLPGRSDSASSQRVPSAGRRQREGPEGQLVRSRRPPARTGRPSVHLTTEHRAVQRRGTDLDSPRPAGPDPGAVDKRLLVIEPEFATVLKSTGRELSTLSPTLRSAWDGRPLALLTRTAPARATEAHISIIGHITQTELRRHTTTVEIANGFLNRFVFAAVRRVRLLPEGGDPDPLKGTGLGRYLTSALGHARAAGRVTLNPDARELWWQLYPQLTQPADGLLGQLTARAEAHVIRLALIYALLDGQKTIQPEHLHAALALWDYAERSAAWALGQATGDPLAEHIHAALARSPDGLTRTQIRDLCQRNLPADRVEQALHALAAAGRAQQERTLTGGRPAELWTTAPSPRA